MKYEYDETELGSPAQQRTREIVQGLPEEPLSLTWRSSLNARLAEVAVRRRRLNLLGWMWKPAAGLAVAGALAVAVVLQRPEQLPSQPGVESALVNVYMESTASWEVATDGLTVNEANEVSRQDGSDYWEPEDVTATL